MKAMMYKKNREKLQKECGEEALIIVSAPYELQATHDSTYRFQQDAQFFWLTGIESPGWKLIIDGKKHIEYLIAPMRDETEIIFNGNNESADVLIQSDVTKVIEAKAADALLHELAHEYKEVHTPGADPYTKYLSAIQNPSYKMNRRWLSGYFDTLIDCRPMLNKVRAIKNDEEIARMRQAIAITCEAFEKAKNSLAQLNYENELEAEFDYVFRRNNATHAYEPIVASGSNGLVLHYVKNNARLTEKGLVVMDIGAAYKGYAADITRTYAIGTITAREAAVHAAVERAQAEIIGIIAPGVSLAEYQDKSDRIMKEALHSLGLLAELDDAGTYRKYFPHAVSHGLGVDVHESLGGFKQFEPGMVLTVEPGIYIPEEGIGVRIEDDILVTPTGNENLSSRLATSL